MPTLPCSVLGHLEAGGGLPSCEDMGKLYIHLSVFIL